MRAQVTLDDKYRQESGPVFMGGIQALVRLPMLIRDHDRRRGLNTAGFISGYRGPPLGGYDTQLELAAGHLAAHDIVFRHAINEDLAATAVWGTQHVPLFPGAKTDGVFGLWYGKSPGVDRSMDAIRHANFAGTSPLGGVLAIAGDDHASKSSTLPNQSEFAFMDAEVPVLAPATLDVVIDFGVRGVSLSRYSGCWVALKVLSDQMDSSAVVHLDPSQWRSVIPAFDMPPEFYTEGVSIRLHDSPEAKERRHRHIKLPAAQAFARANGFDRLVMDAPRPRIGIAASGKAYLHVLDALRLLRISGAEARDLGLRLWKVGLVWPLDPAAARAFAGGLQTVLVVEERRALIEPQLRDALYDLPGRRPRVLGKRDASGAPLLRDLMEFDSAHVALALFRVLPEAAKTPERRALAAKLEQAACARDGLHPLHVRSPFYCAGCPHNSSTTVPEGGRALAGIGCHYMAQFMPDRRTDLVTQMGGEGVTWVGQAPFTDEKHVFVNLGDGTYFHSGLLAIRQAVAANVNITYKILYNDAVAMTGGQHVDGQLSPITVAQQVATEGVARIILVSETPERWRNHPKMPARVSFYHRDAFAAAEAELQATKGVTVLIYDQMCATERRRRRKRGLAPQATQRIFINAAVCEGCGDCSAKSNCVAVGPKETELGRKREIDQSACNIDTSCVKGFCPSFVALDGAAPKKAGPAAIGHLIADLPEARPATMTDQPFNVLLTGIGGLGVTSLSAILGMAAHIDGLEAVCVDQTGLAQRGGAVDAHVRLLKSGVVPGGRIPLGETDVLIAADMVTAHGRSCLPLLDKARTHGFLDARLTPTAEFTLDTKTVFDPAAMTRRVRAAVRRLDGFDAGGLARSYLGDAVFSLMVMLGAAWQSGALPLTRAAVEKAIALNGAAVKANLDAFALGRAWAEGRLDATIKPEPEFDLEAFTERRMADLTAYQNAAYAAQYKALVDVARKAEAPLHDARFSEATARYAFKLMAYKDEYEVARLYGLPEFRRRLAEQFEGTKAVHVWLAPPLLGDKKRRFGPWVFGLFAVLRTLKGLRGTPFDPFGHTPERRRERALIADYAALIRALAPRLAAHNLDLAVALARLPDDIRGFGPIKTANADKAEARRAELKAQFDAARPAVRNVMPAKETEHV